MEKPCKDIKDMLVDYADGRLSQSDSSKVSEHLARCEDCQKFLDGLRKSLEMAGVIWADGLADTEAIRIDVSSKTRSICWRRYAAAASILLVVSTSIVWQVLVRPQEAEISLADIERRITDSASAARLLAAAELLAEYPDARPIVEQQYRYVIETYPQTTAANEAKSRMK
jgi:predicted anti-sigma-YlaC factor YlaD